MVSSLRSRVSTLRPLPHKISVLWLASSDLLQIKLIFVPSQKRSRVELVLRVRARARARARVKTRVKTRARARVRDQHRCNCDQMTHPILLSTRQTTVFAARLMPSKASSLDTERLLPL